MLPTKICEKLRQERICNEEARKRYPGGGAPAPRYSISCPPAPKEKCITSRVVIKGTGKVRKKIRKIKAEYQDLDEVIRRLNKNLKQLKKSMKEFNELRRN